MFREPESEEIESLKIKNQNSEFKELSILKKNIIIRIKEYLNKVAQFMNVQP